MGVKCFLQKYCLNGGKFSLFFWCCVNLFCNSVVTCRALPASTEGLCELLNIKRKLTFINMPKFFWLFFIFAFSYFKNSKAQKLFILSTHLKIGPRVVWIILMIYLISVNQLFKNKTKQQKTTQQN